MKKLILALASMAFIFTSFGQEESKSYRMYDFVYIKPHYDQVEDLAEAMAKHSREFHNEKPHQTHVWFIQSGAYTGWWAWIMGPCTYTDLDHRPNTRGHMKDWISNVLPYVDEIAEGNFWKLDTEVSHLPEGSFTGKEIWSNYDIKPFEGYRFTQLLKNVKKVYVEKNYDRSFEVYRAQFDSRSEGEILITFSFKNWAFFDEDNTFKKDYEEVHGEGSWNYFMEEYRDIVISTEDQIAEFIPELSGGTKENN